MNSFVYVDDLVANALIESITRSISREISFDDLERYGSNVEHWWKENKGIVVTVLMSKYYIDKMMCEFSDFFDMIVEKDNYAAFRLKQGKTSDDLRKEFRSYLSVDMLTGFIQAFDSYVGAA